MPFSNEFIRPEDEISYRLAEIDKKHSGGNATRQWTIDRDRNIYLRNLWWAREEEFRNQGVWTFYWKGSPLTIRLDLIEVGGKPGGPTWLHWRLVFVNGDSGLPGDLLNHRQSILNDLRQALAVRAAGGVFSQATECSIALEVSSECVL